MLLIGFIYAVIASILVIPVLGIIAGAMDAKEWSDFEKRAGLK